MFPCSKIVINRGEPGAPPEGQAVDAVLSLTLADLKAEFLDPESGKIQYHEMLRSETFRKYEALANSLRSFHLDSLSEPGQRLAFWINIYNAAVIHGVVRLGVRRSVREIPFFFCRAAYEIGGHRFSLQDMEHGILRSNRRAPYGLLKPFRGRDPRRRFVVSPLDPRIHFALVCGARSCPPVGFYEADRVDFQLDLAAASFINGPEVEIIPEDRVVLLSKIFRWYRSDFGGTDTSVLETLLRFLDEGEKKHILANHRDEFKLRYRPYDWNLNA